MKRNPQNLFLMMLAVSFIGVFIIEGAVWFIGVAPVFITGCIITVIGGIVSLILMSKTK